MRITQIVDAMIDIEKTIFKNEVDKINLLRYQAKDDSEGFKSILNLIILNDMIEWSEYLGAPHHIIQQLVDKRTDLILHNTCITPYYSNDSFVYTNVNIPQSNDTWKRVWDCPEVISPVDGYISRMEDNLPISDMTKGETYLIDNVTILKFKENE